MIPEEATIIAYAAGFERSVLRALAQAFPDLGTALQVMAERAEDLLPVTRASWYHRDQLGSWSIKAVLPTVTSRDYSTLAVQHGGMAQEAWAEAVDPATDPLRKAELDEGLRAYCQRDTWGMVELVRKLLGRE